MAKAEVGFYPKERPGMGQALKGQVILTDQRFVYVRYTGGKFLTAKAADYSGSIEDGLRNEGSFAIPLSAVTEAKGDRMWGTPYIRLRYRTEGGERVFSMIFTSSLNAMAAAGVLGLALLAKNPGDQLAKAIEQLKSTRQ